MTDPISDMLTRIRNANRALLTTVELPHSRVKEGIARLLKQEGYLAEYEVQGKTTRTLRLKLKFQGRKRVIEGIRRISSPGLRRYVGSGEIPKVLGGMGVAILSTPKGILTGVEARRHNVGGEVLCYIW